MAALSAEDLTVRRGATRPDAPCRAKAIAAHFMIAAMSQLHDDTQRLKCQTIGVGVSVDSGPIWLSEASIRDPRLSEGA